MPRCFFEPVDRDPRRFVPTVLTRGPWSAEHQHGGPPAALMVREVERCAGNDGMRVARVTVNFVRPVPIAPVEVKVSVARPGKRIAVYAVALSVDGERLMRAEVLRIRRRTLPLTIAAADPPLPAPEGCEALAFPFFVHDQGYHTAIAMRRAREGAVGRGALAAWLRCTVALIGDEPPSPAQRALIAADSGNGVSYGLDWKKYLFINPDLTVQLVREPDGEWIGVDARSLAGPDGIGLAESVLHDASGPVGRGTQTLFLDEV